MAARFTESCFRTPPSTLGPSSTIDSKFIQSEAPLSLGPLEYDHRLFLMPGPWSEVWFERGDEKGW